MIGLFLRNKDNEVCFVQVSSTEVDISNMHYTAAARIMTATMTDYREEMFQSEIAHEIHEVMTPQKLLIVQLDAQGNFAREYRADLTIG